jgi:hypothetical protein
MSTSAISKFFGAIDPHKKDNVHHKDLWKSKYKAQTSKQNQN